MGAHATRDQLQRRIARAKRKGDEKRVRKLQAKLEARSRCSVDYRREADEGHVGSAARRSSDCDASSLAGDGSAAVSVKVPIWDASVAAPAAAVRAREALQMQMPATELNPTVELARQFAARDLMKQLQHEIECSEGAFKPLPNSAFETWQFAAKLGESGGDPLLPGLLEDVTNINPEISKEADTALALALEDVGVCPERAATIVSQLRQESAIAAENIASRAHRTGESNVVKISKFDEAKFQVSAGTKYCLPIHAEHLAKLRTLYERWRPTAAGGSLPASTATPCLFFLREGGCRNGPRCQFSHDLDDASGKGSLDNTVDNAIFCLLARHEGLQGGGFQAALNEEAFDVLNEKFDVRFECFASPLNSRYGSFCSVFPDVDFHFGSCGSFFGFDPSKDGGSFQANPPFVPVVIAMMADRIDRLLTSADQFEPHTPLSFIVIIPAWKETSGWQRLNASPFLQRQLLLDQVDHGYTEGKQWMRKTRWRIASFNTSIFFLQNSAGADKYPATDEACEALRRAFASKQALERSTAPNRKRNQNISLLPTGQEKREPKRIRPGR